MPASRGAQNGFVDVVFVDWYKTLSTSLFWEHGPGCRLQPATLAQVSRYVFGQHQLVRDRMLGAMDAEDVCALAAGYFGLRADDVLADPYCIAPTSHAPELG